MLDAFRRWYLSGLQAQRSLLGRGVDTSVEHPGVFPSLEQTPVCSTLSFRVLELRIWMVKQRDQGKDETLGLFGVFPTFLT